MSNDPQHPELGALVIDVSKLDIKDLTPEQRKKVTKLRKGALTALQRILQLTADQRDAAGISPIEMTRATALLANYEYADELLPPVEKLAELVYETKLFTGHQIANLLTEVARQVRSRAERGLLDQEVLAALDELLEYQYGIAYKAQLTKAKKAKAEAELKAKAEAEQKAEEEPAPQQAP